MDRLWPDLSLAQASARLHQASSYARRALGDARAVVLRGESVMLWPERAVVVDALVFEETAARVLRGTDSDASVAIDMYVGDLLPLDPYVDWLADPRRRLRSSYLDVLRRAGRWGEILVADPTDEAAHVAVIREQLAAGRRAAALRQFELMESVLRSELGVGPGPEARGLLASVRDDRDIGLVGRSVEQLELIRLLDQAGAGAGCVVSIEGEAGVGKTALAAQLVQVARDRGWHVGCGSAAVVDGARPYGAVLDGLGQVLAENPDFAAGIRPEYTDEFDRVRATIAGRGAGESNGVGHQRLYLAASEVAAQADESDGLVLVLDDMHEADPDTLALVGHLCRFASIRRRMIVLVRRRSTERTSRRTSSTDPLWSGAVHRLTIGPLPSSAARQLVESISPGVDEGVAKRILALADGNPFYVNELTMLVARDGALPSDVSVVVSTRIDRLDPEVTALLSALALASVPASTDEILALSGRDEHEVFDALTRAMDDEFLVYDHDGYSFRHALVRAAFTGRLAPHDRTVIYRRAARVLEGRGVAPCRVARLLIAAGDHAEAVPTALAAAEAALTVGAYREACDLVDTVVDHASGADRVALCEVNADALAALGDPRSLGAYRTALRWTRGAHRRVVRAKLARAAMMSGDFATAGEALDGLEVNGDDSDAAVLLASGMFAYFTGDLDRASTSVSEARSRLDLGDPRLLDVLTLEGMVAHNRGEWFERMLNELRSSADSPELASTVFDCHL